MASNKVGLLLEQAKYILREKGLIPLIKQMFLFLTRFFFSYRTYYIYENKLSGADELKVAPKIQDFTLDIISNPKQFNQLVSAGFDRSSYPGTENIEERLNQGAILFCLFVRQDLAHKSWVTTESKARIDPVAPRLDYLEQAYIGDCVTKFTYRGLGLYPYVLSQICKFLRETEKKRVLITTLKGDISSIKGITRAGFELCGEGKIIKIFRWEFWGEINNRKGQEVSK